MNNIFADSNDPLCQDPPVFKLCLNIYDAWFYNHESDMCDNSRKVGCSANTNTFGSEEECIATCSDY